MPILENGMHIIKSNLWLILDMQIRRGNVEMVLKIVDLLKNEIPFEEESVVYLKMSGLV
ncbi:unnamed protein product [Camellia sinensis]